MISNISNIKQKATKGLVTLLAAGIVGLGVAGCAQNEPKKSESMYVTLPLTTMNDENEDGKIDAIIHYDNGIHYAAIDTNVIKKYQKSDYPVIMDSSMVELATKIAKSQRDLTFKMDSINFRHKRY